MKNILLLEILQLLYFRTTYTTAPLQLHHLYYEVFLPGTVQGTCLVEQLVAVKNH